MLACLTCGKLTPRSYCPQHQPPRPRGRHRNRLSSSARGYTAAWRTHRAQAIQDHPWCAACGSLDRLTGDHITPLSRGGDPLGPVLVLCLSCNSRRGAGPLPALPYLHRRP